VLYVHGGGYVHPLTADYWRLVRSLARAPAEVVVPAYPLAPGHHVDEVLPALVEIATSVPDDVPLVLMGDSAGGALVLAMAIHLRDSGATGPAGIVCLCPWLNPRLDEPEVERLEASDPMLAESGLRAAGRWWAGDRSVSDPDVDPLNGRLDGLPPTWVFIGDRDILRPAVDELADRASRSELDLTIQEVPDMFHVWMTRAIPEGGRTRRQLRGLLRDSAGR
jgi:acetyl esterase/lipase